MSRTGIVDIEWLSVIATQSLESELANLIKIEVFSPKLKDGTNSPATTLFRSAKYDLKLSADPLFFSKIGKTSGYTFDLVLLRKENTEWKEFLDRSDPIVGYTFQEKHEDITTWHLTPIWPEKKTYLWKGDFAFQINMYRRVDSKVFRKLLTKTSSIFTIFSKPAVFLEQKSKRKDREEIDSPNQSKSKIREIAVKPNQFYPEIAKDDPILMDLVQNTSIDADLTGTDPVYIQTDEPELVLSLGSIK